MTLLDGLDSARPAIYIPTFIGSALSMTACALVLLCYVVLPQHKHFRHVLIINLTVADFVNSSNNVVSGIYIIANPAHKIPPGRACNFNAWLGQLTVQAVDFSVLAISLCLLWTIRQSNNIRLSESTTTKVLICLSIWIVPTITSCTGLILRSYGPVSGNWCWIHPSRPLEQYLLGHGWRITIVIVTLVIYGVVSWKLKRVFKGFDGTVTSQTTAMQPSKSHGDASPALVEEHELSSQSGIIVKTVTASVRDEDRTKPHAAEPLSTSSTSGVQHVSRTPRNKTTPRPNVNRMLLLHGYPILYVLLWLPGLANRLVSVVRTPPLWLSAMQASTQFVGLANAITYGYNENVKSQVRKWWRQRKSYVQTYDTDERRSS